MSEEKKYKCKKCNKTQPEDQFFYRDKEHTKIKTHECKSCHDKRRKIKQPNKYLQAYDDLNNGLRICSICKEKKEISCFSKNKHQFKGISNNCKECSKKKVADLQQTEEYKTRHYAYRNYGIKPHNYSTEIKEIANLERCIKKEIKYELNGKQFESLRALAKYIELEYGIPRTTTEKRYISFNKSIQELIIPEHFSRMINNCWTKKTRTKWKKN